MSLKDLVIHSATRNPDNIAIQGNEHTLTYRELDALANRIARAMAQLGITKGDRVGLWMEKSVHTVAAMQGALRLGAAYVPIDPQSPALRAQSILRDCQVKLLVTTNSRADEALIDDLNNVACLSTTEKPRNGLCWQDLSQFSDTAVTEVAIADNDLAYILYTSGSTGTPKGVCISNRNALAFIEWAAAEIQLTPSDRLTNHAPFHFDLSVFDLYSTFLVGASVYLIPEGISYIPNRLVDFLREKEITVCYCVPSALVLMMEHGNLLGATSTNLRAVIFAGEPFSIKHLRRLHEHWPSLRLLNWYGPTETNVCTSYEVFQIEADRSVPVPIGKPCCGDHGWAVKSDGSTAAVNEEGELMITGPTVMLGYWGKPAHGNQPYPTGDIVKLQPDGNYLYVGRRDQMVKIRGHRIELGDIEAAVLEHSDVQEVGVVVNGSGMEAKLVAYLTCSQRKPSLLEIKQHCAKRLPRYMIVDEVRFIPAPPRTSTGKINRKKLMEMLDEED